MDLLAGKRVLVTGGSGFLGGPVVAQLSSHDVADVAAPAPRSTTCATVCIAAS
jgi:uncharacterized protein YbjT (DUF2867 family)